MSRFERPIIDCCATWSTSSGWHAPSVSAAMTAPAPTNFLTDVPREFAARSVRPKLPQAGWFDNASSINRRCGARLKDRDLCVAVSPLVDEGEAVGRDNFDLLRFLDHAKRVRLKPPSPDERGERRSRKSLPVGRIEERQRKRAAGRRRTELCCVGAPDARHSTKRQRLDIGAQKRAGLGAVV